MDTQHGACPEDGQPFGLAGPRYRCRRGSCGCSQQLRVSAREGHEERTFAHRNRPIEPRRPGSEQLTMVRDDGASRLLAGQGLKASAELPSDQALTSRHQSSNANWHSFCGDASGRLSAWELDPSG